MKVTDRRKIKGKPIKSFQPGDFVEIPRYIVEVPRQVGMVMAREAVLAEEDREKFHIKQTAFATLEGWLYFVADNTEVTPLDVEVVIEYRRMNRE